jgi:hypothetical protein
MKILFKIKRNKKEIFLVERVGYSGNNTCIVTREGGKFNCRCIDIEKIAECDMSQYTGDLYGSTCPLYYKDIFLT